MGPSALTLKTGSVVVLEGLDKAGKSTQPARMKAVIDGASATFAHMPSGFSDFTARLYRLLEDASPTSPLTRQLSHLACHSEAMPRLVETISDGALVLDRWWWSTLAYGWYGRGETDLGIDERTFRTVIDSIWAPISGRRLPLSQRLCHRQQQRRWRG